MQSGLTASGLEERIHTPLERDYFRSPQVHVKVSEYHSLQFFISGAVNLPGMYEMDFKPHHHGTHCQSRWG